MSNLASEEAQHWSWSWNRERHLLGYNWLEVQIDLGWKNNLANEWFRLGLETRSEVDHPGAEFKFGFLRCCYFHVAYYDSRHWNDEENRYFKPGEEQ